MKSKIDLNKHPCKKNRTNIVGEYKSVYLSHKKAGRLDNHLLGLLDRSHEKTLYVGPLHILKRFFILSL